MLDKDLWIRSGHWSHYRENMYTTTIDEKEFAVKPMNCPGSLLVYNMKPHSYKELPMRVGELGLVHRHEKAGALHGLMRVRCFTQDDAHIFMTKEQITDEIEALCGGSGTDRGTGGMITKIHAAKITTEAGIPTVIMNGTAPQDIYKLIDGHSVGTIFLASR